MRPKLINLFSHIAGWTLFFSLILAFFSRQAFGQGNFFSPLFSYPFLIFAAVYLILFYLNYLVLVPGLFLKKKYALYFGIICVLFMAVYFIMPFDRMIKMNRPPNQMEERMPPPPNGKPRAFPFESRDINSIILFITICSLSTSIPVIRQWRLTENRALKAETDKTNAELSFLKSQVNPHFLFNILNNIYALAITNNENTASSIMKLSNIMRYITDEAGQDFVALDNEVKCIRDYIDLQQLRLSRHTVIHFSLAGNTTNKKIAPLILMPFVENVFKYGVSSHEHSDIAISITVEEDNIIFCCQNSIIDGKRTTERKGTGIDNVKQRLQYLYHNRHTLQINKHSKQFYVRLVLTEKYKSA